MDRTRTRLLAVALLVAAAGVALAPADGARARGGAMSLERKVGQMLMAGVDGLTVTDDARRMIGELSLGNVVLMGRNVESPTQVLALTQGLQALALEGNGLPLLISTDQEGGRVQRLRDGFTRLPPAAVVGAANRPDLARAYGKLVGTELLAVGVNLDLAPVLDVNDNPANPVIGDRSFGVTPDAVEAAATAFLHGLHDAGVAATGKHFPGHGNTSTDSHLTLPFVDKDRTALAAVELQPFRAGIGAGIDAIMPAHVVYRALDPDSPATVSRPIVTELLRGELGFRGVVVTDDMGMTGITERYSPEESAVRAVLAGADVVLCARLDLRGACGPGMLERLRQGLLDAARSGRLPIERIDASVERIVALKARYGAGPVDGSGLPLVDSADHRRLVGELAAAGR